jgi:hypothetical protein
MVGYNYIRQADIIIILLYYRFIINYYIVIASYCMLKKLSLIIKLKLTNVCVPLNFLSSSATARTLELTLERRHEPGSWW